jgi:hypothetical protein
MQGANIENFLNESQCSSQEDKLYLKIELLGNRRCYTRRLYLASLDGWYAEDFHRQCDGRGPTISLFKVKDGPWIGGFTTV